MCQDYNKDKENVVSNIFKMKGSLKAHTKKTAQLAGSEEWTRKWQWHSDSDIKDCTTTMTTIYPCIAIIWDSNSKMYHQQLLRAIYWSLPI